MKSRNFSKKRNKNTKKMFGGGQIILNEEIKKFIHILDPFFEPISLEPDFLSNPHKGLLKYIEYIDLANENPLNNPDFIKLFNFIEVVDGIAQAEVDERLNNLHILSIKMRFLTQYEVAYHLSRNTNRRILEIHDIREFLIDNCDPLILAMLAKSDLVELITLEMIQQHIIDLSHEYNMDLTQDLANYAHFRIDDIFEHEDNLHLHEIYVRYATFIRIYTNRLTFKLSIFNDVRYAECCNIDTINREYIEFGPDVQHEILQQDEDGIIDIFNRIRLNEQKLVLYDFMLNLRKNPTDTAMILNVHYMDLFDKFGFETNENNFIIEYLQNKLDNNEQLSWLELARNKNDEAMHILRNCINNLEQHMELRIEMDSNNFWRALSTNNNETAIDILSEDPEQRIDWVELARNKNTRACTILLERINNNQIENQPWEFMFWQNFSRNENDLVIDYLNSNKDKIRWSSFLENKNKYALPIIKEHLSGYFGYYVYNMNFFNNPHIFIKRENVATQSTFYLKDKLDSFLYPHGAITRKSNVFKGINALQESALARSAHGHIPVIERNILLDIDSDRANIITSPNIRDYEANVQRTLDNRNEIARYHGINHQTFPGEINNNNIGGKRKKTYKKSLKKKRKTRSKK